MSKRAVFALGLIAPLGAAIHPARAGSCGPAAAAAADAWKKYGEIARKVGCAVSAVASQGTTDYGACYVAANTFDRMAQEMSEAIDGLAEGGPATPGPRPLPFGQRVDGALSSTGGWLFISAGPSNKDEVTLTLFKESGKARTRVTVCKVDKTGKAEKLWETAFDSGKDHVGKQQTRTFKGARDQILTVYLDVQSLSSKFTYWLKANKK